MKKIIKNPKNIYSDIDIEIFNYNKEKSFRFLEKLLEKDEINFRLEVRNILICFSATNKVPENFSRGIIELALRKIIPNIRSKEDHLRFESLLKIIKRYYDIEKEDIDNVYQDVRGEEFSKVTLKQFLKIK